MSYVRAIEQLMEGSSIVPIYMIEAIYDTCALRDMALMCGACHSSDEYEAFIRETDKQIYEAEARWREEKRTKVLGRPKGSGKPRRDWSKATPRLPEKEWLPLRGKIFRRDGYVCRYCSRDNEDIVWCVDHVVPLSRGGTNNEDNLVVACFQCNSSKNDKLLSEWGGPPAWLR